MHTAVALHRVGYCSLLCSPWSTVRTISVVSAVEERYCTPGRVCLCSGRGLDRGHREGYMHYMIALIQVEYVLCSGRGLDMGRREGYMHNMIAFIQVEYVLCSGRGLDRGCREGYMHNMIALVQVEYILPH